jgi:hypothetical protein
MSDCRFDMQEVHQDLPTRFWRRHRQIEAISRWSSADTANRDSARRSRPVFVLCRTGFGSTGRTTALPSGEQR